MRAMIALEQADGSVDVVVIEDVVDISTTLSSDYGSAIRSTTTVVGMHGPSYREHRPAWFPVASTRAVEA